MEKCIFSMKQMSLHTWCLVMKDRILPKIMYLIVQESPDILRNSYCLFVKYPTCTVFIICPILC